MKIKIDFAKNISKQKILIILIFTILTSTLLILPQSQLEEQKNLDYYLRNDQNFQAFKELNSEERNKAFESSPIHLREAAVEKIAKEFSAERLREHRAQQTISLLNEKYITSSRKPLEAVEIERVIEFGHPSLKWSESENGKNIIGNPDIGLWLNLEDIPINVYEIEYKDQKFILRTKQGGEIIIEQNTINNNGELKLPINNKENIISLQDIIITGKDGKVFLTERDGFKIEGNSELFINGFKFTRGKVAGPSFVKITDNGFVIQGVDLEYTNFLKRTATDDKTIISFGGFEALMKGDKYLEILENPEKIIEYLSSSNPLDNIVREASFNDRGIKDVYIPSGGGSGFGTGTYVKGEGNFGDIAIKFNEEGNIVAFKKGDNWIPLSHTNIDKIYRQSSDFVKSLIDRSKSGESISYQDVQKEFYEDLVLKKGASTIKIDSYQDKFIAINGDNLIVGGENKKGQGEITLLRDLNSLTGYNSKNQIINVGDKTNPIVMRLDGESLSWDRKTPTTNGFKIDDISLVYNGEIAEENWRIEKNNQGYFLTDSDRVIAGKEVVTGPLGSDIDISLSVPNSELQRLGKTIDDSEKFKQELLKTRFSVDVEINSPLKEVSVDLLPDEKRKALEEKVSEFFKDFISKPIPLKSGKEINLNENVQKVIYGISSSIVQQIDPKKLENLELIIRNNPNSDGTRTPQLFFASTEGTEIPIRLDNNQQELLNDLLEVSVRLPDIRKGEFEYNYYNFFNRKTFFWPPPHLRRIWDRLGGEQEYLGTPNRKFRDYLFNKYTIQNKE